MSKDRKEIKTINAASEEDRKKQIAEALRKELEAYEEGFSCSTIERTSELGTSVENDLANSHILNFQDPYFANFKVPIFFSLKGNLIPLAVHTWDEVLRCCLEQLLTEDHIGIKCIEKEILQNSPPSCIDDSDMKSTYFKLSSGQWIAIPQDVPEKIKLLEHICRCCDIPASEITIRMTSTSKESSISGFQNKHATQSRSTTKRKTKKKTASKRSSAIQTKTKTAHKNTSSQKPLIHSDPEPIDVPIDKDKVQERTILFDPSQSQLLEHALPFAIVVDNHTVLLSKNTWSHVLLCCINLLIEERSPAIEDLEKYEVKGRYPLIMEERKAKGCFQLLNNKYLNVNYSTQTILQVLSLLFESAFLNIERIQIWCLLKAEIDIYTVARKEIQRQQRALLKAIPECKSILAEVIAKDFNSTFTLDSSEDMERLIDSLPSEFKVELCADKNLLKACLMRLGPVHEGKVYLINHEAHDFLQELVAWEFLKKTDVLFYHCLYEGHKEFLLSKGVVRVELVKELLKALKLSPVNNFQCDYFTLHTIPINEDQAIHNELMRIKIRIEPNTDLATITSLLPYIPADKIQQALNLQK